MATTTMTSKRPLPDEEAVPEPNGGARPQRAFGGFVDSDSDDSDDEGETQQKDGSQNGSPPPAKKRMLERPTDASESAPFETTENGEGVESQESQESQPMEGQSFDALQDLSIPDAQVVVVDEEERYDLLFGSAHEQLLADEADTQPYRVQTCAGRTIPLRTRKTRAAVPYEAMVAARSRTKDGRATRSFYGIDIHDLVDGARKEMKAKEEAKKEEAKKEKKQPADQPVHSVESGGGHKKKKADRLWTEKYRARSFMDLVGDDLTNRLVLRWLKRWDPVVFPHAAKGSRVDPSGIRRSGGAPGQPGGGGSGNGEEEEKPHRKILLLAGPPGLGKTTLAHVCARQAGYEVLEINASDDRSRDVVSGRIRTSLGTESVKTVEQAAKPMRAAAVAAETTSGSLRLATRAEAEKEKETKARAARPAKVARPVCVVVDEVDGVVSGSGGSGEGGFVKALIDLVTVDQRNSGVTTAAASTGKTHRRKKDDFRQMRPLILICNDVYHASLRPLRQSGLAEIVHVGKPSVDTVVARLKSVFEKEGIACEKEAARKLCEAAWGMSSSGQGPTAGRRQAESTAEGDLRGVMVVGEWVARRLRASSASEPHPQLTRFWVDKHVLPDLAYGAGGAGAGGSGGGGGVGARGLGRGGVREIVSRVFQEGAGFPRSAAAAAAATKDGGSSKTYRHEQPKEQMSFAEHQVRYATTRLREMVETSGEVDRILTDVFAEYPRREFNDDSYLSKPCAAYEWLHFHDLCARRIFGSQEWELGAYMSQPVLACHQLFASPKRHVPAADEDLPGPFTGARADFEAREAERHSRAALQALQAQLPPSLLRSFRSPEAVATDLLPYVVRLVAPDVKPVLVHISGAGGPGDRGTSIASVRRDGEKVLVRRAAEVLADLGIRMQRGVLEEAPTAAPSRPQWVYRMEPDLDMLVSFETAAGLVLPGHAPTRYAVRQVLDQELRKTLTLRDTAARQARFQAGRPLGGPDGQPGGTGAGSTRSTGNAENAENAENAKSADAENAEQANANVKRDFFGRVVVSAPRPALQDSDGNRGRPDRRSAAETEKTRVWVTYHEGLNNAVRKPISVAEFLRGV